LIKIVCIHLTTNRFRSHTKQLQIDHTTPTRGIEDRTTRKKVRWKMAKKKNKVGPFVNLSWDNKASRLTFLRYSDNKGMRVILTKTEIAECKGVHVLFKQHDSKSDDDSDAIWLDYSDVQWLAQAMPEILNEMERRGLDD
jgi:hypothetical protein